MRFSSVLRRCPLYLIDHRRWGNSINPSMSSLLFQTTLHSARLCFKMYIYIEGDDGHSWKNTRRMLLLLVLYRIWSSRRRSRNIYSQQRKSMLLWMYIKSMAVVKVVGIRWLYIQSFNGLPFNAVYEQTQIRTFHSSTDSQVEKCIELCSIGNESRPVMKSPKKRIWYE